MAYLIKAVNYKNKKLCSDYNKNFIYPFRGVVSAEDWDAEENCGGGIHGVDDISYSYDISSNGSVFLIIEYWPHDGIVRMGNKIKIKTGKVVFLSKKISKIQKWLENRNIIYRGYRSTLTGGYGSTLTGGYGSTLTWKYFDGKRIRLYTIYVGEDVVLPNQKYHGFFDNDEFKVEKKD